MRFRWDVGDKLQHPLTGITYTIERRWWKKVGGIDRPHYTLVNTANGGKLARGQKRLFREGWKEV